MPSTDTVNRCVRHEAENRMKVVKKEEQKKASSKLSVKTSQDNLKAVRADCKACDLLIVSVCNGDLTSDGDRMHAI